MSVRYQAIWKSMDGFKYRIDIEDSDYSGDSTAFELDRSGFTLTYAGDTTNITTLILPSSVSVNFLVQDAAHETFINEIAASQEGRFFIKIYEFQITSYSLIWAGLLLVDLIQFPDLDFPYNCLINATDGLARLENIEYAPFSTYPLSFISYLTTILSELEISNYWSTGSNYLSTSVNFYENKMYSGSPTAALDPLLKSGIYYKVFYKQDSDGIWQGNNYLEILNQICLVYNARLFLANGQFYFINIDLLKNDTIYLRHYDKAGTHISDTSAFSLKIENLKRNSGLFSFFRPLNAVNIKHVYTQATTQSNRIPAQSNYETAISLGLFAGGNKETAKLLGTINISLNDPNWNPIPLTHVWHFKMRFQIGNYYLEYTGGVYTWATSSAARIDIYKTKNSNVYTDAISINITTPAIEAVGEFIFELDFYRFEDTLGNPLITPPNGDSYTCSGFSLYQTGGDGDVTYIAENIESGTLGDKYLPDFLIADGPSSQSDGRLMVYDTNNNWTESLANWKIDGSGDADFLINIIAAQVLALQNTARRLYESTIKSESTLLWPYNTFLIESKKYVFLSGTLNANTNEWTAAYNEIKET